MQPLLPPSPPPLLISGSSQACTRVLLCGPFPKICSNDGCSFPFGGSCCHCTGTHDLLAFRRRRVWFPIEATLHAADWSPARCFGWSCTVLFVFFQYDFGQGSMVLDLPSARLEASIRVIHQQASRCGVSFLLTIITMNSATPLKTAGNKINEAFGSVLSSPPTNAYSNPSYQGGGVAINGAARLGAAAGASVGAAISVGLVDKDHPSSNCYNGENLPLLGGGN